VANQGDAGILDILDAKTGLDLVPCDMGMQKLVTRINPKTGYKENRRHWNPDDRIKTIARRRLAYAIGHDVVRCSTQRLMFRHAGGMPYGRRCGGAFDIHKDPSARRRGRKLGGLAAVDLAWKKPWSGSVSIAALTRGCTATAGGSGSTADGTGIPSVESRTGQPLCSSAGTRSRPRAITYLSREAAKFVAIGDRSGGPIEVTTRSLTPEVTRGCPACGSGCVELPERR